MSVAEIVKPTERLVMVVGSYGSGKTEVAVNLALQLALAGRKVQIADLDLVNPYFRCREARTLMEQHGIRVVVPPGPQQWADLPILLPEVGAMLHPPADTMTLFDVGGDDVGAKALASLRPSLGDAPYELWQVLNARRPFTSTVAGCLRMRAEIELASRFAITGFVVNSHLMEETSPDHILEGWDLATKVARRAGLPVRCVTALGQLADAPALARVEAPILRLHRHMLPPWNVWPGFDAGTGGEFEPRHAPPQGTNHGSHPH